jgi:Leucine-rich repeat (LRR) protein
MQSIRLTQLLKHLNRQGVSPLAGHLQAAGLPDRLQRQQLLQQVDRFEKTQPLSQQERSAINQVAATLVQKPLFELERAPDPQPTARAREHAQAEQVRQTLGKAATAPEVQAALETLPEETLSELTALDLSGRNFHGEPPLEDTTERAAEVSALFAFLQLRCPQLRSLDLSSCQIDGKMVARLPELLPELTRLNLSSNLLARGGEAIAQLKNLTHLDVTACLIPAPASDGIFALPRLEVLGCGLCEFSAEGARQLGQNARLRILSAPLVKIDSEQLEALAPLPLEVLELTAQPLDARAVKAIATHRKLRRLIAPVSSIDAEGLGELAGLTELEHLDLRGNPIGHVADLLVPLRKLQFLGLGNLPFGPRTSLSHATLETLAAALPDLKRLHLDVPDTDPGVGAVIANFRNLTELRLTLADLDGDDAEAITAGLPQLREADLSGNPKLGRAGLTALGQHPSLEILRLRMSALTDDALEGLAEGASSLRLLDVSESKLTSAAGAILARFPALEELILRGVPLRNEGGEALAAAPALKRIEAINCGLGASAVSALAGLPAGAQKLVVLQKGDYPAQALKTAIAELPPHIEAGRLRPEQNPSVLEQAPS